MWSLANERQLAFVWIHQLEVGLPRDPRDMAIKEAVDQLLKGAQLPAPDYFFRAYWRYIDHLDVSHHGERCSATLLCSLQLKF